MLENLLLILTGTLTALLAGFFCAFSVAINGAFAALKDSEYVHAMQSINRVILNGRFAIIFFGPVLLLPIATIFYGHGFGSMHFMLLLGASLLYIGGAFGVTMGGNVPLNDELERHSAATSDKDIAAARQRFEKPWNRLHALRTAAAIAATVLFTTAFLVN